MKLKRVAIVIEISIITIIFGFFCFLMAEGILIGAWDIPDKLNWKSKTTPLSPAVISDQCTAFSLPKDDQRCQPDSVVYGPDFFGAVWATFAPKDKPWATYDQVQAKIGKYQYRYETQVTTKDGFTYFVAGYVLL